MNSSVRYHPHCLALLVWLAGVSYAADEDLLLSFGDEDFVSIATGQKQAVSEAPAVATVITASEIEAMGAANLDQVLETVPGLHVALSSYRFSPIYSMRGIHTDKNPQVLMLVNGTPITQLYFGDRGAKNTLPVSNIARIEVIRGPGSAIYGADAFAGVINVITKTSEQVGGTHLGARAGSFNTQELWLLNGSQLGDVELMFSVNFLKTDGDSGRIIDADAQTTIDGFLGTTASLAPSQAATDEKRADIRAEISWQNWRFSAWNWRQRGGVGPGLALALDPSGAAEANNYLVDLAYVNRDSVKDWEYEAKLSYMDINTKSEQDLFPAGALLPLGADGNIAAIQVNDDGTIVPGSIAGIGLFNDGMLGNPEVYEEHQRFDASAFYTGFDRHTIRVAAGLNYTKLHGEETKNYGGLAINPVQAFQEVDGTLTSVTGTPYNFIPDESRTVYYASLQDEWAMGSDWNLTLGVRYDHYSDFGSTINPRVALVWNTRRDLTTKFLYGRAFRAPSFAELFVENNPVGLGNPDLDPETINTWEVAFDYRPTFDLRTGLNVYYYQIDDLIQFIPLEAGGAGGYADLAESGARRANNTGGQTGYGFELEAEWRMTSSLSLKTYYAWQRARFDESDKDVPNAPQHQLFADLRWNFAYDWELSGQAKWVADRKREAGDPRDPIGDYTLTSLVLRRTNIINHLDISLVVNNVFDVDAYEPSPGEAAIPGGSLVPGDFPLAGRAVYGKIGYQF
jgi:iron complex outermembrane receptor protein